MNKLILSISCATVLAASLAQAQTGVEKSTSTTSTTSASSDSLAGNKTTMSSTTTTTTTGNGTVTEYVPGESIVLKTEAASPVSYRLSKKVVYVNKAGKTIEATTVKKSSPVSVHYTKEGDAMIVDRVIVDQP